MKKLICLSLIAIALISCKNSQSFSHRKYTPGRYLEHVAFKPKTKEKKDCPTKPSTNKYDSCVAKKDFTVEIIKPLEKNLIASAQYKAEKHNKENKKTERKNLFPNFSKNRITIHQFEKQYLSLNNKLINRNTTELTETTKNKKGETYGFLSIALFALTIISALIIIALGSQAIAIFLLIFMLAFSVLGLILAIKGLKNSEKETNEYSISKLGFILHAIVLSLPSLWVISSLAILLILVLLFPILLVALISGASGAFI